MHKFESILTITDSLVFGQLSLNVRRKDGQYMSIVSDPAASSGSAVDDATRRCIQSSTIDGKDRNILTILLLEQQSNSCNNRI